MLASHCSWCRGHSGELDKQSLCSLVKLTGSLGDINMETKSTVINCVKCYSREPNAHHFRTRLLASLFKEKIFKVGAQ